MNIAIVWGTSYFDFFHKPWARFTNVLSAKKFVSSFLRTVCVSQTPLTYEFLKYFAKIFLNIVVTLRQGGGGSYLSENFVNIAAFICPNQHTEQNSLIILSKRTIYRQNYRREFILDEYLSPCVKSPSSTKSILLSV